MSTASDEVLERAIRLGWSSFKSSWPLLLVAVLFAGAGGIPGALIGQVGQVVSGVMRATGASPEAAGAVMVAGFVIAQLVGFLVQWPTMAGAGVAALRAQRGHANDFKSLLSGFKRFTSVVTAQFLLTVLAFGVWIPVVVLAFGAFEGMLAGSGSMPDFSRINLPAAIGAALVSTLLNFWITARLGQAAMRAADPDEPPIGGVEALRYSFALTRGHTLTAIGMLILVSTVTVLSVLLCCIGVLLVGMPLALALQAGFYRALRREPDPLPPPPVTTWTGAVPPRTPV